MPRSIGEELKKKSVGLVFQYVLRTCISAGFGRV